MSTKCQRSKKVYLQQTLTLESRNKARIRIKPRKTTTQVLRTYDFGADCENSELKTPLLNVMDVAQGRGGSGQPAFVRGTADHLLLEP